ncbi:hypothetical protein BOTCAL_0392g00060 [Botryotinia calthae]|uniref:Uncharacterized protein n=1 Tax=Botryotinia calthae TaxID=38488 RepID=A0A4Y8CQR1_9HELO|nr:hypothetical protein BOTCAL_0392g00060 [Botryotinia calthae]
MSNTISQSLNQQRQLWLNSIRTVSFSKENKVFCDTTQEKIHYNLLDYFHEWYCYTMHTTKISDYQQLIGLEFATGRYQRKEHSPGEALPKYVIQLQETLDSDTPGKLIFFSFDGGGEYNDGRTFVNHLKSLKRHSGRMDKGFIVLGDFLEREVVYRTYVLGGQNFPEASGQYKCSEVGMKIMGGLNWEHETPYLAVVLERIDVNHQVNSGDERKLEDLVLMRKQRGGGEREVSNMMKSMEPQQKW